MITWDEFWQLVGMLLLALFCILFVVGMIILILAIPFFVISVGISAIVWSSCFFLPFC